MKSQAAIYAEFRKQRRAEEEEGMRAYGRIFEHWRDCQKAACRRARGCGGDLVVCFRGWWRAKTEEERNELRQVLRELLALYEARQAGGGPPATPPPGCTSAHNRAARRRPPARSA